MSDLAAASAALGVPEELTRRSAAARAAANGTDLDEVLAAWAGGGSVASAPTPEPASPSEPASEVAETPAAAEAPDEAEPEPSAAAPEPASPATVAVAPPAVMVAAGPEPDPVEAAPIGDRIRSAGRFGLGLGLVAGLIVALFSTSWLLPRAGTSEVDGGLQTVVEVVPGWVIVGSALIGVALGIAIAATTRTLVGLTDRGRRLVSSSTTTAAVGAVLGAVLGALIGSIVSGTGGPSEIDPAIQVIPVFGALTATLLGWAASGWLLAAAVQAVGVPAGVDDTHAEETDVVKKRLGSAFGIPVTAAVVIAAVVLPLAWIFIQFPSYAPLLAIVVSIGIIGFAGLAASRPGMRITTGEFLAAAAGVGVLVLIIVSILFVQGGGGHGGEEAEGEASAVVTAL